MFVIVNCIRFRKYFTGFTKVVALPSGADRSPLSSDMHYSILAKFVHLCSAHTSMRSILAQEGVVSDCMVNSTARLGVFVCNTYVTSIEQMEHNRNADIQTPDWTKVVTRTVWWEWRTVQKCVCRVGDPTSGGISPSMKFNGIPHRKKSG